ncbi:hypothetical protein EV697_102366 [Bisgaardia hudsonensis]|uniref:Uncharacterized protein n=1 Tax=Bisgaardia hudsonensis TaxID=109472 RepID=A0A4R2N1Q6_9PAST|nr:hypothetical protein [Bisgaardia hudsonensis]QLB12958.1 hypothetical protein A6A11_04715 [Bisgaardia hudsonensis]TCP13480.1 hypothetical protein EV697_102366 [Bisgaardia hudsonensis]
MKCDDKSCSTTKSKSDTGFHFPCCMCLFVILFFMTMPFMQWITAEITTPIRQMMIGDKGIQIYLKPEEWRELRGITTIPPKIEGPLDNFYYLGWEGGEYDDVSFPKFIEVEGIKYEANYIDKKTRVILYYATKYNELPYFWTLGTSYRLFYDPIIHKIIASSEDAFGEYPTPLAGGGKL